MDFFQCTISYQIASYKKIISVFFYLFKSFYWTDCKGKLLNNPLKSHGKNIFIYLNYHNNEIFFFYLFKKEKSLLNRNLMRKRSAKSMIIMKLSVVWLDEGVRITLLLFYQNLFEKTQNPQNDFKKISWEFLIKTEFIKNHVMLQWQDKSHWI